MSTTTRSRAYGIHAMPTSSGDKSQQQQQQQQPPQQPMTTSSGFAGNLYPNENIWSASIATARDRSFASKDSEESHAGSGPLNTNISNIETDVWGPWKNENPPRSTSTSPNRTRDGAISNSAFYEPTHSSMTMNKGGFNGNNFQEESNGHNGAFNSQKRGSQEAAYMDTRASYSAARDSNVPPSRQSQGSPAAYSDLYAHGRGHTPSSSIQSQRPMPTHTSSFQNQSANQRAFNFNNKQQIDIDDDLSRQFSRRVTLDSATGSTASPSFNPASQPFQMNPGSQSWVSEPSSARFNSSIDLTSDALASQFQAMKRPSVDRVSPLPSYRLENSPRSYNAQAADSWSDRPSSRDPRSESTRRTPVQYAPHLAPYYANQYPYANFSSQYSAHLLDAYGQSLRPTILNGYSLAQLQTGYALSANMQMRSARDQDPVKGVRSALLEEFRVTSKSNKRWELKDIYQHVVEFSGDQHGSRFIQGKLETANSDEKDQVFREIEPNAIQLMKDVFGNYVIQKFFEHGNQVQKKVLAEKMKGKVLDLSMQVYACRVVQKALEHVLVEQQAEMTKELEVDIPRTIRDQHGNHVVQKVIELVPRQHLDFVMKAFKGHVTAFASHTFGCRVVQRMLEHGTEDDRAQIMAELHPSFSLLITDQFGNYVAQHVIQNGNREDQARVIQQVISQLLTLSKHKFASNVVEKCIEFGTDEQRSAIREQLMGIGSDGNSALQQMIRDQYGNYVIQKLLTQLEGAEKQVLVEEIKSQYHILKKNGTSRQLQALEKLLGLGAGNTPVKSVATVAQTDSLVPTPGLTNESTSPRSSGPPSTTSSAMDTPAGYPKDSSSEGVSLLTNDEETQ